MRYKKKRVLVVGGTGFVGGRLVEKLFLEEGADVRVLVRNWTNAVWVCRYPVELVQGDITDKCSLAAAFKDRDIVFHCASGQSSPSGYLGVNVEGTRNLLECAAENGVERFVYLSSIAVHGADFPDGADENAPAELTGRAYSDSKILAEQQIREFGEEHSLAWSILRPTFVWGPRSVLFTMRPLLAMKSGVFSWIDHGAGRCNAVYVDNLVEATLLAGVHPDAIGEAFIVTDDERITWGSFFGYYARMLNCDHFVSISSGSMFIRLACRLRDFLETALIDLAPNPAPIWRKVIRRSCLIFRNVLSSRYIGSFWDLEKFSQTGTLDISKIKMMLGYRSVCCIEEGMKDTEMWVRDQMGSELGLDVM